MKIIVDNVFYLIERIYTESIEAFLFILLKIKSGIFHTKIVNN